MLQHLNGPESYYEAFNDKVNTPWIYREAEARELIEKQIDEFSKCDPVRAGHLSQILGEMVT
jgi:hypothetical protein